MQNEDVVEKKTATKVKDQLDWRGDAALYELNPPLAHGAFVIVSAVDLTGAPFPGYRTSETMIFPANAEGGDVDYGEIAFVPYKSHVDALADLGYEVA